MNEQIKTNEAPETAEAVDTEATKDTAEAPPAEEARIAELERALAEQSDRYLRMAAEYDNFRRRSREEKDGVYDRAVADTVTELLPILDNLERATQYEDGDKVKEGLSMTLKSAAEAFKRIGVEAYGEAGDTFDPNLHNAVFHVEDESLGEGVITDVFQRGYKKGDKVIRFAMVKTAN